MGYTLRACLLLLVRLAILCLDSLISTALHRTNVCVVEGSECTTKIEGLATRRALCNKPCSIRSVRFASHPTLLSCNQEWYEAPIGTHQIRHGCLTDWKRPTDATGFSCQIITVRLQYIETTQNTRFEYFIKGRLQRSRFESVLGAHVIFIADGDIWQTQHKRDSQIFSASQLRTRVQTAVHEETRKEISIMSEAAARGYASERNQPVLPELFFRFTHSALAKSPSLGTLSASDPRFPASMNPFHSPTPSILHMGFSMSPSRCRSSS
ncbi:hypothetical protein K437DRAFT_259198 [Tilletiaria anomala UBC 951]|uniref:Uncharacterized protein n=1 Tax=Tilletiaria anomala (strain ATCC 24038 / CBS 436.72 / UBC 951) TaxID=1037660 RepID=A0A066VBG2_TILAU|nr:uncharacterized protein K437DRAFT_259198 [Tilletiaria anomala UBC 951]KDN39092.1 hypothetical protein K437DRAFT_259198 [Tilletiaria anomala UBC 951]